MHTINVDSLKECNKRLGRVINDLSYILHREDYESYKNLIITLVFPNKPDEEDKFLWDLYQIILDKLNKINYGPLINN